MCIGSAARHASLIVSMEFTIESCVLGHHITSPKSFVHWRWEKSLLVCQRKEGDPNNGYAGAVKTDATRTVQIKCNNYLSSFQLHFIINFILTEPKLAHIFHSFIHMDVSPFIPTWPPVLQPG